jgi:hypothetical protein
MNFQLLETTYLVLYAEELSEFLMLQTVTPIKHEKFDAGRVS